MESSLPVIIGRALEPTSVTVVGRYTNPPTYGVYQLPYGTTSNTRFHQGNHPVRQQELDREFGSCTLTFLFASKDDAVALANALNGRVA